MEGKRKNIFLRLLFFCVMIGQSLVFATDFPSMPSIDSPSMPSMSGPSYRPPAPWRGQAPYMPSQQQPSQPAPEATDSSAKASSDGETDATGPSASPSPDGSFFTSSSSTKPKETAAGLALTAQSISGLGGLEALESLGGLGALTGLSGLGGFNGLDALKSLESLRDVKDEDDLQKYLSQLSGSSGLGTEALEKALKELEKQDKQKTESGTDGGTSGAETQGEATSSDSDVAATLEKILLQLEILAAQQKQAEKVSGSNGASATSSTGEAGSTTAGSSLAPQEGREAENLSPSRILRFRANATDVLPTCTTVYFSQPDPAGVFLLTGDRVVNAGGKERNETFYFLFKPTLDESGSFIYEVEAQLMQDWLSDRSELHPLTASLPLTATRTGNLVALRHATEGWHLDLLLDLREVHGD